MNSYHGQGFPVQLPDALVEWLDSPAGQEALSNAAEAADESISALDSARNVRLEDLHQPITV